MSRYRRLVTPEQRARAQADRDSKLQALHQQLETQVAQLRTGEQWQQWLRFAARFHDYSFQNTLLILSQRPEATAVAGYDAWRQLGRQVTKGEKGIAILAPIVRRPGRSDDDATRDDDPPAAGDRPGAKVVGYRPTYVWDVAQTTGRPLPERPEPHLLCGQAPDGLWDQLVGLVEQAGYWLERGECGAANGYTDPAARVVRVRDDLDDAQAVKTLAHELGHVRLHCDDPAAAFSCRGVVEVEAESVAYLVTASHGLDSGAYTFPYVTGWASGIAGTTPEQAVRQTGQRVLTAARWVLDATHVPDVEQVAEAQQLAERVETGALTTGALRGRAEAVRVRAAATQPAERSTATPREVSRAELLQLHREATAFYQAQVERSWVPEYLRGRGLEVALAEPWCAGWAPTGWRSLVEHLQRNGADDAALLASGLASPARTGAVIDRFRDRLVIPLRDREGDVVGFIGRSRPGADASRVPKYLNSPQSAVYRKGELLFGLPETRLRLDRGAMPVLVEGPLDAIAVTTGTGGRCAGLSPCGTALTEAHVQELAAAVRLRSRGVVVATDADDAGRSAAATALALLTPYGVSPRLAGLPVGGDPAELYARAGGAELTAALLDRSRPLADAVIDARIDDYRRPLRWLEERVAALRDVAPLVASLPIDDVRRMVGRLSRQLDLDVTSVQREIAAQIGVPHGAGPGGARRAGAGRAAAPRAPAVSPLFSRPAAPAAAAPRRPHR